MQRIADRFTPNRIGATTPSPPIRSGARPSAPTSTSYGTLPILLALAAVLLLLACANVANLLLVRSVARRREMRHSPVDGRQPLALVRQLMVENLLIALAGGAVALVITFWTGAHPAPVHAPTHAAPDHQRPRR